MEKRISIIAISVLISLSLFSQNFISTDKQWNVRLTGWPGAFTTEIYIIEGDSVVNSMTYNKIWASFDSLSTWQYQGLLREDSDIVYYIPPNANEGILYDFNLEIGDTAYVNNVFCSDIPIYVLDIDTVEYYGISRKRWLLGENGYVEESWVAGIGSLYGPLHTKFEYCIICPFWELLCYHNNTNLEYMLFGETDCYQNTVGIGVFTEKNNILIRPNPVKKGNSIEIEMNFNPVKIDIVNSSGILIQSLTSIPDRIMKIGTTELETGLYIIKVTNQENKIQTLKIIIE